ncbi:MAG: N-acyl homoserine lactonase family protein, partial [Planctomycetes bacterium]|nr:N-acyl homoserine lactonase family protein [Planctomycetota bacterium]
TYTTAYYFWLLEGGGRRVLVDTGVWIEEGSRYMPTLIQEPRWRPERRLAALGVEPGSIDAIVVTHLHFDHLSTAVDLFPRARLFLQRRELETALSPAHPWLAAFYSKAVVERLRPGGDLARRLDVVDGDADVLPGIRVLWTGGHTPGHQSVLFEGPEGPVCLAGDVALFYRHLRERKPLGVFWNIAEVLCALDRLAAIAEGKETGRPVRVLPNHDPELEAEFPVPGGGGDLRARDAR